MAKGFTEEWELDTSPLRTAPIWVARKQGDKDTDFNILDARRAVKWSLSKGITGLAVSTDEGAAFICNAIFETGLRVPQDIAVIGSGNSHFCELVFPSLSSVDLQPREVIYNAAEMLHQLCENHSVEPPSMIRPLIQSRASCPVQGSGSAALNNES